LVISGLIAVFHVLVLCTLPLLLRALITMIALGNRLSLVLALILTVVFLYEGASTNYSKFMTIRYDMDRV
jgi:hypothetical protein